MRPKPILCIDFDGVIHSYEKGWQDGTIYGEVVPGFFEWALEAQEKFYLVVYSSRSREAFDRESMKKWIADHFVKYLERNFKPKEFEDWPELQLDFASQKPPAWLTIDDRAICFTGSWPTIDEMLNFKSWFQRNQGGTP